jgi:site-specific DNA-methyltransferase (cytosine-N4-specific)
MCVVMLDRADIQRIKDNPAAILGAFSREARHAMTLKKLVL